MKIRFFLIFAIICLSTGTVQADWPDVVSLFMNKPEIDPFSGDRLFREGKIAEAKLANQQLIKYALKKNDPNYLWQSYMYVAWVNSQIGDHKEALRLSNLALEVAQRFLKDPFHVGRSFCWLGWSYTYLGLYDLALHFYQKAAELGGKNGKIEVVHVWGLANQEIGALYARRGQFKKAKTYLEMTTNYARQNGIDVGVAEGGASLSEIAMLEGRLDDAESLGREAVVAGINCGCSPFNTGKAKVNYARALFEKSKLDPSLSDKAFRKINEALEFAKQHSDPFNTAASQILLSKALPADQFREKLDLAQSASYLLEGSELRGNASARLGELFLEQEQNDLADFYLKQGLEVNRALFRQIDNAYLLADIANLKGLEGQTKEELIKLVEASDKAALSGATLVSIESEQHLADRLFGLGYYSMALQWTKRAIDSSDDLLSKNKDNKVLETINLRKLELAQRRAELDLILKVPVDKESAPLQE